MDQALTDAEARRALMAFVKAASLPGPAQGWEEEQRRDRLRQAQQELAVMQRQQALQEQESRRIQAYLAEQEGRMAYRSRVVGPAFAQQQLAGLRRSQAEQQRRLQQQRQDVLQQQQRIRQLSSGAPAPAPQVAPPAPQAAAGTSVTPPPPATKSAAPSRWRTLLKRAAATVAAATVPYNVAAGDTLSGIASRNATTWQELARLNGLADPNRLRVNQRLLLPRRPAAPSTPAARINQIAARLHAKLNNPNLEAAILANFDRETGGRFDHSLRQRGGGGGYGLPQYTGPSLTAYRGWLAAGKRQDSATSQVDYFVDKYMPSRAGYRRYTAPGAKFTREQYADWLHRRVFTPAHTIPGNKAYSADAISRATQRHNAFMKNRLQAINGVWQAVKTSEEVRS